MTEHNQNERPRRTMAQDLKDFGVTQDMLWEKLEDLDYQIGELRRRLKDIVYIQQGNFRKRMSEASIEPGSFRWGLSWDLLYSTTCIGLKNRLADLQDEYERISRYRKVLINIQSPGTKSTVLDIETARTVPIEHVFQGELKRKAGKLWGRCPFHEDKTPSFLVNADNTYHCFSCGAHGDVIDLVMKLEGLSLADAVRSLIV